MIKLTFYIYATPTQWEHLTLSRYSLSPKHTGWKLKCDCEDITFQRSNRWCKNAATRVSGGHTSSAVCKLRARSSATVKFRQSPETLNQHTPMDGARTHTVGLCAYLQVPVVNCAAAVRGLRRVLAGVEQPAELAVEPGPRDHELHPWWVQGKQVISTRLVLKNG